MNCLIALYAHLKKRKGTKQVISYAYLHNPQLIFTMRIMYVLAFFVDKPEILLLHS